MSDFPKTYFTSDWHVGHKNCIRFDDRPFKDLNHMHRTLVNNYNATVDHDDICFFGGDMGLTNSETLNKIVSELNGTKVLILGNHDKGEVAMQRLGFDIVIYGAMFYISGHKVTMTHCPLKGIYREDVSGMNNADGDNWHGENRYKNQKFTIEDMGQFHLHGHIHSPNFGKSKKILGKQYDIGVVANNYRPVSKSVIESWIARYGI